MVRLTLDTMMKTVINMLFLHQGHEGLPFFIWTIIEHCSQKGAKKEARMGPIGAAKVHPMASDKLWVSKACNQKLIITNTHSVKADF